MLLCHLRYVVIVSACLLLLARFVGAARCIKNHADSEERFLGCYVDYEMMVDNEHKVLMDWTPKAACTRAVVMFLNHMNIVHGRDYTDWPHKFRYKYYQMCGTSTASQFLDPTWFRFKVVRNPYVRLVSSYFHSMTFSASVLKKTPEEVHNMSFASFIGFLESQPENHHYDHYTGNHATFQHRRFEIVSRARNDPSPFHQIVKLEDSGDAIVRINALLAEQGNRGRPFNFTHVGYDDARDRVAKTDVSNFIGRQPWHVVQSKHPKNYAVMYDEDLRQRVEKLYAWDLVLYNYSWPF